MRAISVLLGFLLVVGCDDSPPPVTYPPASTGAQAPSGVTTLPPPAVPAKKTAEKTIVTAEKHLTEKDFFEGLSNRDPFRPILSQIRRSSKKVIRRQYQVILPRYALDELKLIAVVTGGAVQPRAMFRDPTGLGVRVMRGQRISKNAAKIKRILHDKVVVEIEEKSEDQHRIVDRVIPLHSSLDQQQDAIEDEKNQQD